jgi:hypothetical protein
MARIGSILPKWRVLGICSLTGMGHSTSAILDHAQHAFSKRWQESFTLECSLADHHSESAVDKALVPEWGCLQEAGFRIGWIWFNQNA